MRASVAFIVLFVSATVTAAGLFWENSSEENWFVYVQDPDRGPVPKFKLAWYEQLMVAGFVGAKYGLILTAIAYVAYQAWLLIRNPGKR